MSLFRKNDPFIKNSLYLTKRYSILIIPILLFGINIFIFDYSFIFLFILLLLSFVVLISIYKYKLNVANNLVKQYQAMLCERQPEKLVNFLKKNLESISAKDDSIRAVSALETGTVYAYYGEFNQVRNHLSSVNWDILPPMFFAYNLILQCLLHYFESRDFNTGLSLAYRARQLSKAPRFFPGVKQNIKSCSLLIEVGEILTKTDNLDTISRLEQQLSNSFLLQKTLIAWGLAIAYAQSNQLDKLEEMRSLIQSIAPYCVSLTTLP